MVLFLTEDVCFFLDVRLQFTTMQGDMILTADGNEEVFSKNRSLIGRVEIMVHKQYGTGTPRAFLKRGK